MAKAPKCAHCGKAHMPSEIELSFRRPDPIFKLPKDKREGVHESDDVCRIREERFFIRAVLPLPVKDWKRTYNIGVWVEVQENTYARFHELWNDPQQGKEPAFDAELANNIPPFNDTLGMRVKLKLADPKHRPGVLLPKSQHPLHHEQAAGISPHRANEYTAYVKA